MIGKQIFCGLKTSTPFKIMDCATGRPRALTYHKGRSPGDLEVGQSLGRIQSLEAGRSPLPLPGNLLLNINWALALTIDI